MRGGGACTAPPGGSFACSSPKKCHAEEPHPSPVQTRLTPPCRGTHSFVLPEKSARERSPPPGRCKHPLPAHPLSRPYWLAGRLLPKKPASENSAAANNETLATGGHKDPLPTLSPLLLLLVGIIFEILYLFLLALAPLPELHLHPTPLINDLSWTLALSHLLFPGAWTSAGNTPNGDWLYIFLLAIAFLALAG